MPPWLSARLIVTAAALIMVALLAMGWKHRGQQLAAARAALGVCQVQHEDLQDKARGQNAAIADFRRQAATQDGAVRAAQLRARAARTQAQRRAQSALIAAVPAECDAAVAWARGQALDLGAQWSAGR